MPGCWCDTLIVNDLVGVSMKFGAVISALALSGLLMSASPSLASVFNLHTLADGDTYWGNGHGNYSQSSSTITDTYHFKLSSPTGTSSLSIFDAFLGFSGVTLELFSGFGPSATQIESVSFPSGSDPLFLSDSALTNGRYELKVIDILPPAIEIERHVERHEVTFPSTGGYLLDFNVQTASAIDPPPPGSVSAVPEPSTWAMMMLGFLTLGVMTYRKKSALRFA